MSRLFRSGEKARFNQRVLQVVNGRPSAVRFVVNGEPRRLGRGEGPDIFTVRRSQVKNSSSTVTWEPTP